MVLIKRVELTTQLAFVARSRTAAPALSARRVPPLLQSRARFSCGGGGLKREGCSKFTCRNFVATVANKIVNFVDTKWHTLSEFLRRPLPVRLLLCCSCLFCCTTPKSCSRARYLLLCECLRSRYSRFPPQETTVDTVVLHDYLLL